MADVLSIYKKQAVEWQLKVSTEFPFHYIKQQDALNHEFLFCIEIPWPLLRLWDQLMEGVSGQDVNYLDLINSTVTDGWFTLNRTCPRTEELVRKHASYAKMDYRRLTGRKRKQLDSKVYKLSVRRGEIDSRETQNTKIQDYCKELEEWRRKYSNLAEEKKTLYEDMMKEVNNLEKEVTDLKEANKALRDYVEILEHEEALKCQGKTINDLGTKQKGRKLQLLKNRAQCALWFCKSFGLDLTNIRLQDESGCSYTMEYPIPSTSTPGQMEYEKLSKDRQEIIEHVLFLLDKFCVGDEVYHELSVITEGLPKSYLIKQLRGELNKTYHIERTPGPYPGARLDFKSTLTDHVRELLSMKPELRDGKIQIKISGDGAQMSRSTNFMMFSFALLQLDEGVMSSKSNRTVAIVNGPEKYETMKISLSNFFCEVNELIRQKTILIDGENIELDFFLGGDMKFLLMIMGLNGAAANHSCLWCLIHKDDRWDTSKPLNYYNEEPFKRTLDGIKTNHDSKTHGCIHPPLLNIPLNHVIADELHLLLRVTDRLLQNIIDEVLERDAVEDFNKASGQPKKAFLTKLVATINELGIPFSVWNKKNADGSASNIVECTSLVGPQKKKLLKGLPSTFHQYLYPDTSKTVQQIWVDFAEYYDTVSDFQLRGDQAQEVFNKAKKWVPLFCSLGGIRPGYKKSRVTPYMHVMVYHTPIFVQEHGSFKRFTGQGVEKNNDDAKRIIFHKSNKWDAAKDIMYMESRQWDLKHREREKRPYRKINNQYWGDGIVAKRKQYRPLLLTDSSHADNEVPNASNRAEDYTKLTVPQLRAVAKEKRPQAKGLSKMRKNELIQFIKNL